MLGRRKANHYSNPSALPATGQGEGKVGPSLKTTKLSEDDIVALLSKGQDDKKPPHKKPISGFTDDQAKAVAHYVASLK